MTTLPIPLRRRPHRVLAPFVFVVLVQAAAPTVAELPRLVPADHGAQILDPHTGLAWSRCVEGMHWNGKTCVGQPVRVGHAQALALAAARKGVDGLAWRLPRVTELERLLHRAGPTPGLDPVLFPAAPAEGHWAMTASVDLSLKQVNPYNYANIQRGRTDENTTQLAFLHAWAVNLATGEARGDVLKRTELPVRLVWSLQN